MNFFPLGNKNAFVTFSLNPHGEYGAPNESHQKCLNFTVAFETFAVKISMKCAVTDRRPAALCWEMTFWKSMACDILIQAFCFSGLFFKRRKVSHFWL